MSTQNTIVKQSDVSIIINNVMARLITQPIRFRQQNYPFLRPSRVVCDWSLCHLCHVKTPSFLNIKEDI